MGIKLSSSFLLLARLYNFLIQIILGEKSSKFEHDLKALRRKVKIKVNSKDISLKL